MRAGGEQLQALLDYMVQTTHPGTIVLDGDTASGRAYMAELTRRPCPHPDGGHDGGRDPHRALHHPGAAIQAPRTAY
jgi:hypothetical protein